MSDQQAPPNGDSPAVAGPNEAPGAAQEQDVDWQKRYVDTQAEYSRGQQRLRELENQQQWYELALTSEDPDTRARAIEALGYELPETEEPEPDEEQYEDPYDSLQAQIAEMQERLQTTDQRAQEEQELALQQQLIEEQLSQLEGVDEEDRDDILAYAINALPAVQDPAIPVLLPDIQGAYQRHLERQTQRQKKWATTKRAPYVAPGGQTANEVPDLSTHQGRVDQAMRKMAEADMAE